MKKLYRLNIVKKNFDYNNYLYDNIGAKLYLSKNCKYN